MWKKVLKFFGATLSFLLWGIGRWGDWDFIVNNSKDYKWFREFLSYIIHPPQYFQYILIIVGLAFIVWIVKEDKIKEVSEDKYTPVLDYDIKIQKRWSEVDKTNYWYAMLNLTLVKGPEVKNCHVKINDLIRLPNREPIGDFSPIGLKWEGDSVIQEGPSRNFRQGESHRFTLCVSPPNKPTSLSGLKFPINTYLTPHVIENFRSGEYKATVRIIADDTNPIDKEFKVSVEENPETLEVIPLES